VGERIAHEVLGVEAGGAGGVREGDGVIPAGGGGAALLGGALEEDAEGRGAGPEGGGDARGEAVTGGGSDHEDLLGAGFDGALGLDVIDPLLDMGGAAGGVGGDADKATDLRYDDHAGLSFGAVDGGVENRFWARNSK